MVVTSYAAQTILSFKTVQAIAKKIKISPLVLEKQAIYMRIFIFVNTCPQICKKIILEKISPVVIWKHNHFSEVVALH